MFDLNQLTITAVIDGAPMDISAGAVIDADFLKIAKETAEETKIRKGTKNESYIILSVEDNIHNINIMYLPNSSAAKILKAARKGKKVFELYITNNSEPKYKFVGKQCTIAKQPETVVNGKEGFKDYEFEIKCGDGTEE